MEPNEEEPPYSRVIELDYIRHGKHITKEKRVPGIGQPASISGLTEQLNHIILDIENHLHRFNMSINRINSTLPLIEGEDIKKLLVSQFNKLQEKMNAFGAKNAEIKNQITTQNFDYNQLLIFKSNLTEIQQALEDLEGEIKILVASTFAIERLEKMVDSIADIAPMDSIDAPPPIFFIIRKNDYFGLNSELQKKLQTFRGISYKVYEELMSLITRLDKCPPTKKVIFYINKTNAILEDLEDEIRDTAVCEFMKARETTRRSKRKLMKALEILIMCICDLMRFKRQIYEINLFIDKNLPQVPRMPVNIHQKYVSLLENARKEEEEAPIDD